MNTKTKEKSTLNGNATEYSKKKLIWRNCLRTVREMPISILRNDLRTNRNMCFFNSGREYRMDINLGYRFQLNLQDSEILTKKEVLRLIQDEIVLLKEIYFA